MSCSWCEEKKELTNLCNIEGHRVCNDCYDTYREMYPMRVEGCPYCKGNEEKPIQVIEIYAPEVETVVVITNPPHTDYCDTNIISTTIIMLFIVLIFLFCITKSPYLV